ncbi:bifunctional transaldolase/phosoglucose isomerase [Levilinea saccharolytica]|uniref:Transaldolase n=1 Tax=Levilinea saccharolytica TaxID=229921 RepID=A0A0P6Y6D6_9CHLR|nr:bifunctional transaldolase/phosoglucose isomerase [Levilinea saccharolytica]KPL85120.1 hypothetical protein ADN01_07060 [Levilinea saccharolytica]GAP18237.1 transaldolase [Levilinea saccharolytica]
MSNPIQALHALGQSLWYDNIQRRLLENGELAEMIRRGDIRGITSNPSIFHNAIAKSNDYDAALKPMAWANWSAEDIFFQLAVEDIQAAADCFLPLYKSTAGGDGYVSLEVSPYLAHDTEATLQQALALRSRVNRPNLMVKIPATKAGLPAIRKAIAAGINVNVTLIFSIQRYLEVMDAYLSGLEDRLAAGLPLGEIASVASFFVSRVDSKVDSLLQKAASRNPAQAEQISNLLGKAAVANSRLAFFKFQEVFSSPRFQALQKQGANPQRALWASTSTKNPAYRDVLYVEELIAPQTVNTVPPQTLDLFRDHGRAALTIQGHEAEAQATLAALEKWGISMDAVTQELEDEGVKAFSDAFTALLDTIRERCAAEQAALGALADVTAQTTSGLEKAQTPRRIAEHDPSLWTDDPAGQKEIRQRMGWLDAPNASQVLIPEINALRQQLLDEGYTHALLLGMGGSSLAPEVLALTFGKPHTRGRAGLALSILDSTDPQQVAASARRSPIAKTVYIVASKSGGTSEVNAFLDYFWHRAQRRLGTEAGKHFIAVTDPGTSLDTLARSRGFRRVFLADSTIGGRNSVLSAFGLVPAGLLGLDLAELLSRAAALARECLPGVPAGRNPGLVLGALLGGAALNGRDKLTILTDPELASFGSWMEQLIAESSGKQGKGILPIDLEPPLPAAAYGSDRLFVYLRLSGKAEARAARLQKAGHPVFTLNLKDGYDLGAEFFRWEYATAVACSVLGVNSFDQPDVQFNKTLTKQKVEDYLQKGKMDEGDPIWSQGSVKIFGQPFPRLAQVATLQEAVLAFLQQARPGDFVAINAYLPRNAKTQSALQAVRKAVLKRTGCATTLGFGPRFLHSTGQLHKGGPNTGLFLQITSDTASDMDIPSEGISFGKLERAQALGDLEALLARQRRAVRIHLPLEALLSILQ